MNLSGGIEGESIFVGECWIEEDGCRWWEKVC